MGNARWVVIGMGRMMRGCREVKGWVKGSSDKVDPFRIRRESQTPLQVTMSRIRSCLIHKEILCTAKQMYRVSDVLI
jgi:hypothetical protein